MSTAMRCWGMQSSTLPRGQGVVRLAGHLVPPPCRHRLCFALPHLAPSQILDLSPQPCFLPSSRVSLGPENHQP